MSTIKDVAKKAGVSVSTVSLVLNSSTLVKIDTRDKVLEAIKALDYTPNQYARSLVTNTRKVIGVVWPSEKISQSLFTFNDHINTYLTEMIPSIEREINGTDYSLLLEHYAINQPEKSLPFVIRSKSVGGLLITGGIITGDLIERIIAENIPTVLVGSRHPGLDYVDTDPERAIFLGTKHLVENGHRKLLFINGPHSSQSTERKLRGFMAAVQEYELAPGAWRVAEGDFSGQRAYLAMRAVWEGGFRPSAIVGATDGTAIGALRYLYEQGVHCPGDISAVGFEDGMLAEYSIPPLTTVCVHKSQIGTKACRILLNRIEKPKGKKIRLIIEPELISRGSVRNIG